jgi:hypothetical protein
MARDKILPILMIASLLILHMGMATAGMISTLATLGTLSLPMALALDFSTQECLEINPNDYFKSTNSKAGAGQGGTLRGKPVRYTLTLVPRRVQPSPALPSSLDLKIVLSSFLDVTKAHMKRPPGSAAITPIIDPDNHTVTWENIGNALLGVGSRKGFPQKLTFTITAILATNTPGDGTKIKAYLLDDNICDVQVAEAKVKVREPSSMKAVRNPGK